MLLGAFVLSAYLLTASGQVRTIDIQQTLKTANSIVEDGRFTTVPFVEPGGGAVTGVDGRPYSAHGIGMSILFLPIAAGAQDPALQFFLASLVDAFAGMVAALAFLAIQRRLGVRDGPAVIATLLLAFATLHWPYAHVAFDAMPTAAFLLLGVAGLLAWSQDSDPAREGFRRSQAAAALAGSGAAFGFAVLLRADAVFAAAPALVMVAVVAVMRVRVSSGGSRGPSPDERARHAVAAIATWLAPMLVAIVGFCAFNQVRFGGWFNTGHADDPKTRLETPLLEGLRGLLVSPGKSVLLYSPLLIVALLGWPRLIRRRPAFAATAAAIVVGQVVFHALLFNWSGDEAWGPRFIVPAVALALLPLGLVLQDGWPSWRTPARIAVVVVAAASFGAALVGSSVDYLAVSRTAPLGPDRYWAVDGSPFGAQVSAFGSILAGDDPYAGTPNLEGTTVPFTRTLDYWWLSGEQYSRVRWFRTVGVPVGFGTLALSAVGLAVVLRRRPDEYEEGSGPEADVRSSAPPEPPNPDADLAPSSAGVRVPVG